MSQEQKECKKNFSSDSSKDNIPPNGPDKTRLILVFIAAGLATLSFVAFIISGNPNVLVGTTSVLAYPLYRVIDYYFGKPQS